MNGRELVVGVTGGIAAYKTATLVSRLVQAGAGVSVVMTRSATQLVAPKTFEALTGRPVGSDLWEQGFHPHIELAGRADLVCIAPATANLLAKAAHGLADDLLSTLLLAYSGPVIFAPAMNHRMWAKAAVQRNVAQLRADGFYFVDPEEGYLSCGAQGAGRMAEPETIFEGHRGKTGCTRCLKSSHIPPAATRGLGGEFSIHPVSRISRLSSLIPGPSPLIPWSAFSSLSGPTRQYVDPVRYLSNASSGRMGAALAEAVLEAGHEALVVSGPVEVAYPDGVEVRCVVSTEEMLVVCLEAFPVATG